MSGKHYNRALRVHNLMLESLERLFFRASENQMNCIEELNDDSCKAIEELSETPNADNLNNTVSNQMYCDFKESVRNGSLAKTAMFWMNYMNIVWLVLTYIRATKQNDFELHLSSLYELCPLFFTYNHHNYTRYIPANMITMLNLPVTHPGAEDLLRRNGFGVSRSNNLSSRNPVDITTKETINCHAKSHGGIIGFSRNHDAYQRWCTTRHSRAKYVEATFNVADMSSNEFVALQIHLR